MATIEGASPEVGYDNGRPAAERIDIWPHRSLGRRGTIGLLIVVAVALVLVGIRNSAHTHWPIAASCLVSFSGLAIALTVNHGAASRREVIEIGPRSVEVVRQGPNAIPELFAFDTYFVRVEIDSDWSVSHRLVLTERGRRLSIGEFLSPAERQELGERLRRIIDDHRSPNTA